VRGTKPRDEQQFSGSPLQKPTEKHILLYTSSHLTGSIFTEINLQGYMRASEAGFDEFVLQ
jgi:hypothetical protein